MAQQKHDFHLVDPSPWPILAAFAAGLMMFGIALFMHPEALGSIMGIPVHTKLLFVGVLALFYFAYRWWRDVVREAQYEGHHTPIVQLHHRYGMIFFIASEVMFFAAFFWAFFDASLYPKAATGGVWPPKGIEVLDPFHLPLFNTLLLLLSGTTVTWAHHALLEGQRKDLVLGLSLTVLLGVIFTSVQIFEYTHVAFKFSDGIYPSTFFMATGFHGFHVLVGTIFLAVCLIRAARGHFTPQHHFGFEAAAWYWHFVDVVWLFLFACIYWWGA
jgi:cytochrome c oxidase subunit 3